MDRTPTLAAIDVGTNSVRMKLARTRPDGSLDVVCEQRDPVRPGEGVFGTGNIAPAAVDRLLTVLARYATICRAHGAEVRAVATSALREAHNRDAVLARARDELGLALEILSGRDEARLICLGVLRDEAPEARSLVIDVGGGSTEVISARGARPVALWSVDLGSVRLTERVSKHRGADELRALRRHARDIVAAALPRDIAGPPDTALGSSGTIRAVVAFAAPGRNQPRDAPATRGRGRRDRDDDRGRAARVFRGRARGHHHGRRGRAGGGDRARRHRRDRRGVRRPVRRRASANESGGRCR